MIRDTGSQTMKSFLFGNDIAAFYDDGVGTSTFKPRAIVGGAFGFGLKRNVIDIHKFTLPQLQGRQRRYLRLLNAAKRRAYDREQKRCQRKYAHEDGTMYRSFEAFCGADVARNYSAKFLNLVRSRLK
jgi:hypothetical protein